MNDRRKTAEIIKELQEKYFNQAVEFRRRFHEYPELGFKEEKTSEFVSDFLRKLGLKVETGIAGTGVKAVLKGNGQRPVVGLRADLDALTIQETNDIPYCSKVPGIMHACGHDFHIANLLITALIAVEIKDRFSGDLVFLFQPCEEGNPQGGEGGALQMIRSGVMENPHIDFMLGQHVFPELETGSVGVRNGSMMSNVDFFFLDVIGKSAHGAYPHKGIDAIYVSALVITELQGISSRLKNPVEPAILTVGKIEGGERMNILANKVHLEGTVRTLSNETQMLFIEKMENILNAFKISHGIDYRLKYVKAGPYLKNDSDLYDHIVPVFEELIGRENVKLMPFQTVGEDFAYYSHSIPSFFFFVGAGNIKKGIVSNLHTSNMMLDEDVLKIMSGLFLMPAISIMKKFPEFCQTFSDVK